MSKELRELKRLYLTPTERKALNSMISETTYSAVAMGFGEEVTAQLMEIVAAAFIQGVAAARESVKELNLN